MGKNKKAIKQNSEQKTMSVHNISVPKEHIDGLNITVINLLNENNRLKQELGMAQKTIDDLRNKDINSEILIEALKKENAELKTRLAEMGKEITELKQKVDFLQERQNKERDNKLIRALQDINALLLLEQRNGPKNELIKLRKDRIAITHYIDKNEETFEKNCSCAALYKYLSNLAIDTKNKFEARYGKNVLQFYKTEIEKSIDINSYSETDIESFINYFD